MQRCVPWRHPTMVMKDVFREIVPEPYCCWHEEVLIDVQRNGWKEPGILLDDTFWFWSEIWGWNIDPYWWQWVCVPNLRHSIDGLWSILFGMSFNVSCVQWLLKWRHWYWLVENCFFTIFVYQFVQIFRFWRAKSACVMTSLSLSSC